MPRFQISILLTMFVFTSSALAAIQVSCGTNETQQLVAKAKSASMSAHEIPGTKDLSISLYLHDRLPEVVLTGGMDIRPGMYCLISSAQSNDLLEVDCHDEWISGPKRIRMERKIHAGYPIFDIRFEFEDGRSSTWQEMPLNAHSSCRIK